MNNETFKLSRKQLVWSSWIVIAALAVFGIYRAISLRWVCDDAFISFRYAANLINGHGLVFNVGEQVEGYTNFLWTMLIALGMKLRIDPVVFSQVCSITAYLATVMIFIRLSKKLFYTAGNGRFFFPLAAVSLLLQRDYHVYATSGLETASYAMFISLAFMLLLFAESDRSYFYAGLAMVFVPLSRPDGLMFCVLSLFYILLIGKGNLKKALCFLIPLLALYLPYWLIRYSYYGYPFPNTYYAKSGNLAYYSQGIKYFLLYFKTNYVFILAPVFALVLLPRILRDYLQSAFTLSLRQRAFVLSLLFIIPYVFFIVRVGGDFMFARFFIPVTPLLFFFLELGVYQTVSNKRFVLSLIVAIALLTFFRFEQYKFTNNIDGVSDEWQIYPEKRAAQAREVGEAIYKYFRNPRIQVLFRGMQAMEVYYADFPVAIEDSTGLTDEYIAHLPLQKRGIPGHEKHAPLDYLIRRKVNFLLHIPEDDLFRISFEGYQAEIFVYDNEIMAGLKKFPEVEFVDFPQYLDEYIRKIDSLPSQKVRIDYNMFKTYYFDNNDDVEREEYFIQRL